MHSYLRFSLPFLAVSLTAFAQPVTGIRNFDKVDDHVYRGGQPTDQGFRELAKFGVKVVIDLREADDRGRAEERTVTATGMRYVNVPMTGLTPPRESEISKILAILEDPKAGPVFVHCKRGADRTGAVIGAYQISDHRWTNQQALKDALAHGMSFFEFRRQGYVKNFQPRDLNAKAKEDTVAQVAATPAIALPAARD